MAPLSPNECHLQFKYYIIFQPYQSFEALVLLRGEIDICVRGLFCTKFNFEQFLFKTFFSCNSAQGLVGNILFHFFSWCEIIPASKKQKNIFVKTDKIKIDFSIIDFFYTDYRLDRFFTRGILKNWHTLIFFLTHSQTQTHKFTWISARTHTQTHTTTGQIWGRSG